MTANSHIFFYSGMTIFCISSILICLFRHQLRKLCDCCCSETAFTPKVDYHVSDKKIDIIDSDMRKKKPEVEVSKEIKVENLFENHENEDKISPSAKLALKPGQVKVETTQPVAAPQSKTAVFQLELG